MSSMVAPHNSEREVRVLRRAAAPGVIELWESFRDGGGHLVLVLPFMPVTLHQLIVETRIASSDIPGILRDLFRALAHVHSFGIIHRDVKPSNILLKSPAGPAVLSDFGIAWAPSDPDSEPPASKITDVGTACYRAPELLFGHTGYDTSLDQWAAGCVAAELYRGSPLFETGDAGSDLTLVQSILTTLGTPNKKIWPVSLFAPLNSLPSVAHDAQEIAAMPDWGKIPFNDYLPRPWAETLKGAPQPAQDLVSSLVKYSGHQRLSAEKLLATSELLKD
jgi:serine/threonine protein kinase